MDIIGTRDRSSRARAGTVCIGATLLAGGLVLGGLGAASASTRATPVVATPKATSGFARFSSCTALRNYVLPLALERVGPYGFDSGPVLYADGGIAVPMTRKAAGVTNAATAAAPASTAAPAVEAAPATPVSAGSAAEAANSSSTNTQEVGVDEGDIVETDGRIVYSVIDGVVRVVDMSAGALIATIALPPNAGDAQLLLDGKRLAVVTPQYSAVGPETIVTVYDVSNPAAPRPLVIQHLEGSAVAVRSVGHRARLVLNTPFGQRLQQKMQQPTRPLQTDADIRKAIEANRKVVKAAPITEWLPRTYTENVDGSSGSIRPALSCGQVGRPRQMAGLGTTWVATIDLDTGNPSPQVKGSAGVVAEGSIVYASTDTLYVATNQWQGNVWVGARAIMRPRPAGASTTDITAFDMRPADGAAWLATGTLPGTLLNQFSMSEYQGALRVASTRSDAGFGGTTVSGVQVMQLSAKDRRVLTVVGQVWGLGTNEQIYAVRFIGDQGYVVTFRQTDPLYVIDLRDIRAPRVAGQLKIPGYSAYLHPIGDGLLIGVGQDATDTGRRLGTQVSLFDVRDPANPQRLGNLTVGGSSEAEYDHHAFLWWGPTRNVVVPSQVYGQCCDAQGRFTVPPSFGATVARIGTREAPAVTLQGKVSHDPRLSPALLAQPGYSPMYPIRRSLIVNGRLVTVSSLGVLASDLTSLADQTWVAFPGR